VAGAVLLSGALVYLLLAISQGRALGWGPAVTLAALVVGVAMFGGITLVPQLIQTGFGFSATQVGLMMLPVAATMLVASPLAARIGAGYGLAFASVGNLVVNAVEPHQTGVATGVNTIRRGGRRAVRRTQEKPATVTG
jgi:hypothetical protein